MMLGAYLRPGEVHGLQKQDVTRRAQSSSGGAFVAVPGGKDREKQRGRKRRLMLIDTPWLAWRSSALAALKLGPPSSHLPHTPMHSTSRSSEDEEEDQGVGAGALPSPSFRPIDRPGSRHSLAAEDKAAGPLERRKLRAALRAPCEALTHGSMTHAQTHTFAFAECHLAALMLGEVSPAALPRLA